MINIKSLRQDNKPATVLLLIPIVFLGTLILSKAVNVVFWDEWELTPIFQHIDSGHLYWMDFWAQHNEHRILIPNIALTLIAELTHWNVIVECMTSFAVACVSFWLVLSTFKATAKTSKKPVLLMLLLSLIWFSPVQVENWLWGWQLEWFLSVLGLMMMTFGLSKINKAKFSNWMLVLILSGGLLAQYSLGNGTLVWPLVIAALLYKRLPIKQTAVVVATSGISTALYYLNYATPVGAPSRSLALHEPIAYAKFVLLYLGRPLSYIHNLAMIAGLVSLAVFIGLSLYLFIREKPKFNLSIPWIFLGLYAIASALITGLARLGFGVYEGGTSRYTTISSLLLISTLILCWQNRAVFKKALPELGYKLSTTLAAFVVFALVLSNVYWGVHAFNTQHKLLSYLKVCTRQTIPPDECLLQAYPSKELVKTRLDYLKSVHWNEY